jgi:tetratricopeptide (TPR) repeat protein
LGVAYQRLGQVNEAVQAFTRARTLRPEVAQTHIQLGSLYLEQGDLSNARKAFEQAVSYAPDRADLKYQLAWIAEQQSEFDRAETLYREVSALSPDHPDAHFRVGYLRLQRADYQRAAEAFRKCLDQRPDWREAELNLAMSHWKLEEYSSAEEVLEKLIQREPGSIEGLRGLAAIALDQDHPEKALEYHLRLHKLGDTTPDVLYNSALLSQRLGRMEDAILLYKAALAEKPGFAEALLNLGHALKAVGKDDEAKACWIPAIEAKPELAAGYFSQS